MAIPRFVTCSKANIAPSRNAIPLTQNQICEKQHSRTNCIASFGWRAGAIGGKTGGMTDTPLTLPSHRPAAIASGDWLLLLALSVLWGGSFFFSKVALAEVPPLTMVLIRVGLAAAALLAVLRATGQTLPRQPSVWAAFFGMGFLNNLLPFSLIFWGQTQIASGLAAILNATTPLFTVVVAHWLTADEKATGGRVAGVLLGFAGVAAMIGPGLAGRLSGGVLGELACLGAALSYAFAGIFGRRFRRLGVPPLTTAFGQLAATTAMMLPIAALADGFWRLPMPSGTTWAALIALALASTALAYVIFFRLLGRIGATNLALVTFLIPVSAILLGGLVLGERLAPAQFAGMALIGLGLAAIDGRAWRLAKRRRGD